MGDELCFQSSSERREPLCGVFVMSRSSVRVRQAAPLKPQVTAMIWGFWLFAIMLPGMAPSCQDLETRDRLVLGLAS